MLEPQTDVGTFARELESNFLEHGMDATVLADEIDARVHLLKRHLPYHESDHVLNLAYNAMLQGVRLQDIELRRNDEAFLDGLGA